MHRPQLLVHQGASPITIVLIGDRGQRLLRQVVLDAFGAQLARERTSIWA